jgi:hypothetical protein
MRSRFCSRSGLPIVPSLMYAPAAHDAEGSCSKNSIKPATRCTSSGGSSSLRSTPAATAEATAGSRCPVAYGFPYFPRSVLMESMYKLVECERIDFAPIPTIELHAKRAHGLAQVAFVSDLSPFSHQAFDSFRNFVHRLNARHQPRR